VNGSGDLFPKIIPVLNAFARANPDVKLWIVTRQFGLAARIEPLPNVYLQLSIDSSTPPAFEKQAIRLVWQHPRAYLSFLRVEPTDDTRGAAIVFNEKATEGLPFNGRTDCPVDAGRLPLGNIRGVGGTACSRCRKCFSDRVLERQRERLRDASPEGDLVQLGRRKPEVPGAAKPPGNVGARLRNKSSEARAASSEVQRYSGQGRRG
jgi:hypothetical protein